MEIWKCLRKEGLDWLTELFNVILSTIKMPNKWRISTVIPLCKDKGDIQHCNNYRDIKLLSHIIKLWERVIEGRLRKDISISKN